MMHRTSLLRWATLLLLGCLLPACNPSTQTPGVYRFDDNLENALSVEGPQLKRFHGDKDLEFDESIAGWTSASGSSRLEQAGENLMFTSSGEDRLASPTGLDLDGAAIDTVELKMKVTGTDLVRLNWVPVGTGLEEHRVLKIQVPRQNEMIRYDLKMSEIKSWRHRKLDQILFHVTGPAKLEIESIRFLNRRYIFSRNGAGVVDYSIDNQLRPALYSHCPGIIKYRLKVPKKPVFTAGLSILEGAAPVTFELVVEKEGSSGTVLSQKVDSAGVWHEARADLAAFADQEVILSLISKSEDDTQVALWSNPVVFGQAEGAAQAPNVVLYVIDCLRADHLEAYGYERATAPNLAEFARQGARFERCFAQDTWTKSSCSSFHTGVDQFYHGVEQYGDVLPAALQTFPELLRRAGYETCVLTENPHTPPETLGKNGYSRQEPIHLKVELGENLMSWQQLPAVTLEKAASFVKESPERPFFLYAHTMELHDIRPDGLGKPKFQYDPPQEYRGKWTSPGGPIEMDNYDAAVAYADANFKRFMDMLEQSGVMENTIVIVTADHGEAFGEHEGYETHHWKPYNTLTHVPLMVRWPGKIPAGVSVRENVQLLDLAPTILDLAGLEPFDQFQGASLEPLMLGKSARAFRNRLIVSRWYGHVSAVRGDWKLLGALEGEQSALFNLAEDMKETRDVAAENPGVVQQLKAALSDHVQRQQALRGRLNHVESDSPVGVDPRVQEQMDRLGYGNK